MGFSIGDLYMTLLADGGRLRQSIEQEAGKAADAAGAKVGKTFGDRMAEAFTKRGKALQQTGQTLTKNVTAPILGLGAAIVSVGVDFDTTLRQIVALTDVTADEIGAVRSRILDLATALGKSPQELAEGFYFLASAGFNTAEAMEVLESTAKASASGLGTTADIAKVVGGALNAYGHENLSAADATDILLRAINKGTAEAPDFASALGDVQSTAALVGASYADTSAALAGMTLASISADEAATSLNRVFLSLLKTTPAEAEAFESVGLSVEGLRQQLKEKGLLSVLQTLDEAFQGNEAAIAEAFGEMRAFRGVTALTGLDAAQLADVFGHVNTGLQNIDQAFAETEGPGREFGRAMAEVQVALIELADDVLPQLIPVLKAVVGFVHTGVEAFKALPEPVRGGIVQLAALAAVLGPLIFVTGKFASGIGSIISGWKTLAGVGKRLMPVVSKVVGDLVLGSGPGIGDITKKSGGLLGSTLGKAFSIGFAAVAVVEVFNTYNDIKRGLDEQLSQISTDAQNQLKTGTDEALAMQKAALEKGIADLNGVWDLGIFTGDARAKLQAELDATNAEITRRASEVPVQVARELEAAAPKVAAAADEGIEEPVKSALEQLIARAKAAGRKVPESLAGGILEKQGVVPDAMDVLRNLIKNELTPAQQIARDIGILTSEELAEGLKDKRPGVRAEAQRVQAVTEQELAELILAGGKVGKKAMDELKEGLHDKNPKVRAAAERVRKIVKEELDKTEGQAYSAGAAAASAFKQALKAGFSTKMALLARIEVGGRAEGGPVAANVPYIIGELGPEVFVPDVPGTVLPNDFVVSSGGGGAAAGGDTFNLYLPDAQHRDPWTVLDRLPRYAKVAKAAARQTGWSPA